jgi:dGTPase
MNTDAAASLEPNSHGAESTARATQWASTMTGVSASDSLVVAHADSSARCSVELSDRPAREVLASETLSPWATRSTGAGVRAIEEAPDPWRTAFERDRDRILHAPAFRRLAGKTQVFIFPDDHQRTRLTHALEVAQVATSVARALRLNVALTEAIALGHDCGHGPGGHASEDALSPYVEGGYNHAVWGADVTLASLNLCVETLDGIRNHSWSRPAPSTPEAEVVSWADRIAYVCHDLEDAVASNIVSLDALPDDLSGLVGRHRREQLTHFITALVNGSLNHSRIGMAAESADALGRLRRFNYEKIYLRADCQTQNHAVIDLLRSLVEHYAAHPHLLADAPDAAAGGPEQLHAAVAYVGGMTDRFACDQAQRLLGWPSDRLPKGIDVIF